MRLLRFVGLTTVLESWIEVTVIRRVNLSWTSMEGLSSDLNRIGEGFETGDFEPIRSRTGDLVSWFLGLLYVERDAFIAGRIESDSFGLKWFRDIYLHH